MNALAEKARMTAREVNEGLKATPAIERELQYLEKEVDAVSAEFDSLYKAISPALSPVPADDAAGADSCAPIACPLAGRLHSFVNRLTVLRLAIQQTTKQVEL